MISKAWKESLSGVRSGRQRGRALATVLLVAATTLCGARVLHAIAPPGRYTDDKQGTIVDAKVHLEWQHTPAPVRAGTASDLYTWDQASQYCTGLSLRGGGWRLPTVKELLSLVDRSVKTTLIDQSVFPGTTDGTSPGGARSWWWTNTKVHNTTDQRWVLYFLYGTVHKGPPANAYRVRCVRSVQ